MRTLGLIPARGGSKGVPRKNIRTLAGKPLLQWTVEAATASHAIDRLVLSTDDEEIADIGRAAGCEVAFLRPRELARDETPGIDVALHALGVLGHDYEFLVLLQPTSPLRRAEDISSCVQVCRESGAPGCLSVVRAAESPFWMFLMTPDAELRPVVPRASIPLRHQDLPPAFRINGAVYAARPPWLVEHHSFFGPGVRGYEMPASRSIDIDSWDDWLAAEAALAAEQAS
jgi:CMP-N,N'-diacetyllegionaminic acid synthase